MMNLFFSKRFIQPYFIFLLVIVFIYIAFLQINKTLQGDSIYIKNMNELFLSKENRLKDILSEYNLAIKALKESNELFEYINNQNNKTLKSLQSLFVYTKKSFPDITQIRYLDINGNEIVRIDGDAISLYKEKAKVNIIENGKLQNKGNKNYFLKFRDSEYDEVSYSMISLNKDNGKVTIPKEPTIRIGTKVYAGNNSLQGVLILNISLRDFFTTLSSAKLYDVMIVDNKGKFITHNDSEYGLIGDNNHHMLEHEFPKKFEEILKNNEVKESNFYSSIIHNLENEQQLKMVLRLKNNNKESLIHMIEMNQTLIFSIFLLLLLPVFVYILRQENN